MRMVLIIKFKARTRVVRPGIYDGEFPVKWQVSVFTLRLHERTDMKIVKMKYGRLEMTRRLCLHEL